MQSRLSACMVGAAPQRDVVDIMEGRDDSQSRPDLPSTPSYPSAVLCTATKELPLYRLSITRYKVNRSAILSSGTNSI